MYAQQNYTILIKGSNKCGFVRFVINMVSKVFSLVHFSTVYVMLWIWGICTHLPVCLLKWKLAHFFMHTDFGQSVEKGKQENWQFFCPPVPCWRNRNSIKPTDDYSAVKLQSPTPLYSPLWLFSCKFRRFILSWPRFFLFDFSSNWTIDGC